jgi:uncharacterized protein YdeI (YjbR/CyaY-like superfamily)
MGTRDPRVDAYIDESEPFARPILKHLRKVIHAGCPDVEETMKWNFPHFMHHGILCSMASFKQHCAFGFWRASLLKNRGGKSAEAMGQYGRLTSINDLPPERNLIAVVKQAAKINERGVHVRRLRAPRPAARTPADLAAALRNNRKALATFQGFSPGNRRDYIEWITDAKGEGTRKRRLETAVVWMAEGKPRNWKYMTKRETED